MSTFSLTTFSIAHSSRASSRRFLSRKVFARALPRERRRMCVTAAADDIFALNVTLRIKEERREEFLKCIEGNAAGTLSKEPLALMYTWGEDDGERNTFHFHEQYRGRAGFEAHTQAPHFATWEAFAASEPFTAEPEVQFFSIQPPPEAAPAEAAAAADAEDAVEEFLAALEAVGCAMRLVVVGDGAILETTASLDNRRVSQSPKDGSRLCTFSSDDYSFELHVRLAHVKQAAMVTGGPPGHNQGTLRITRLLDAQGKSLLSVILSEPSEEEIARWEALRDSGSDGKITFG